MSDSVQYTIKITHHIDGEIEIAIEGVGDSESDREAIAYALSEAINLVKNGDTAIFH
jgi:hypothetical protein